MDMQMPAVWQLIALLLFVLTLYFFSRAIQKAGYSPWWAALGLIPIVNIVMLWVFAFARWPRLPGR